MSEHSVNSRPPSDLDPKEEQEPKGIPWNLKEKGVYFSFYYFGKRWWEQVLEEICSETLLEYGTRDMESALGEFQVEAVGAVFQDRKPLPLSVRESLLRYLIVLAKAIIQLPDALAHPAEYRRDVLRKAKIEDERWDELWPPSEEEKIMYDWSESKFQYEEKLFFETVADFQEKNWPALYEKLKKGSEFDCLVLRSECGINDSFPAIQRSLLIAGEKSLSVPTIRTDFIRFLAITAKWLFEKNEDSLEKGTELREKTFKELGIEREAWEYLWPAGDLRIYAHQAQNPKLSTVLSKLGI